MRLEMLVCKLKHYAISLTNLFAFLSISQQQWGSFPSRWKISLKMLFINFFLSSWVPPEQASWSWNAAFCLWKPCALDIVCTCMPLPEDQVIILTTLSAMSWNLLHFCLYQGDFCLCSFDFKISVVSLVCPASGWSATLLKYIHFKKKHITLYYIFHSGQYLVYFF